jgi:hypothetical protein
MVSCLLLLLLLLLKTQQHPAGPLALHPCRYQFLLLPHSLLPHPRRLLLLLGLAAEVPAHQT